MMGQERGQLWEILQQVRQRDGALMVHASFRRLSQQGWRAEACCEALMEWLSRGTLLMPAMTWRSVGPRQRKWDEIETPGHTGVLGEVFRLYYATARSVHPTHSVCGWGRRAEQILGQHWMETTPVGWLSPWGRMAQGPAAVLMLGVGLECCTAFHRCEEEAEQLWGVEHYLRQRPERYYCRRRNGETIVVWTRRHKRRRRDFEYFRPALRQRDILTEGSIGSGSLACPWTLVDMQGLAAVVMAEMERNPRATLAKRQ